MLVLVNAIAVLSLIVSLVGWLWIVVSAFSEGEIGWGIGSLVCGPVSLIYGIMNFDELKIPVILAGTGIVGRIVAAVLMTSFGDPG